MKKKKFRGRCAASQYRISNEQRDPVLKTRSVEIGIKKKKKGCTEFGECDGHNGPRTEKLKRGNEHWRR